MAGIRVKVKRLKLLGKLEEWRVAAEKDYAARVKKYERDSASARHKAGRELQALGKALVNGATDIHVSSDTIYRGGRDKDIAVLQVGSVVTRVPSAPHEHPGLEDVKRTIALLDQSDDDTVSISTDDMRYYGISALAEIE